MAARVRGRERIGQVAALLAAGVSAIVFLSLISYSPDDLPFHSDRPNLPVRNWCGPFGAHVAGGLFEWLGWGSFLFILLVGFWSVVLFSRRKVIDFPLRIGGSFLFLITVCALLSTPAASLGTGASPSGGGFIGFHASSVLKHYLAPAGTYLLLITVACLSLFLSTDWFLPEIAGRAGRGARVLLQAWILKRRRVSAQPKPRELAPIPFPREPRVTAFERPKLQAPEVSIGDVPETKREERKRRPAPAEVPPPSSDMKLPPIELLDRPERARDVDYNQITKQQATVLVRTLADFSISAEVVNIERGPAVTMFELELAPGIKVQRIMSLCNDLAIALRSASARIVAPIPGKSTIGVEVPNPKKDIVRLRELIELVGDGAGKNQVPLYLGKDISGVPVVADLAGCPHLLIAGATGSGKSVCLNSIVLSILMTKTAEDVRVLMVDPKMVEMSVFRNIPHLKLPIVTDMKKAALMFQWCVREMERRYDLFSRVGVRDIARYNTLGEQGIKKRLAADIEDGAEIDDVPFHLAHLIIIVDELADLMMMAKKDIEWSVVRLSQKSRAVGIHIILATQRPSVDIITGLIKANITARIAFQVSARLESRIILDQNGAERLLGSGDMLFLGPGTSKLIRAQGTYTSDAEIKRVVSAVESQGAPVYDLQLIEEEREGEEGLGETRDDLYEEAIRVVLGSQRGSVSLLQRKLEIGYTRAARLIDMMAAEGLVGEYKGSKAREVVMSLEEWENMRKQKERSA